jgi:hypothetical protein
VGVRHPGGPLTVVVMSFAEPEGDLLRSYHHIVMYVCMYIATVFYKQHRIRERVCAAACIGWYIVVGFRHTLAVGFTELRSYVLRGRLVAS